VYLVPPEPKARPRDSYCYKFHTPKTEKAYKTQSNHPNQPQKPNDIPDDNSGPR